MCLKDSHSWDGGQCDITAAGIVRLTRARYTAMIPAGAPIATGAFQGVSYENNKNRVHIRGGPVPASLPAGVAAKRVGD